MRRVAVIAAVVLAAGCGGSSTSSGSDASVCAEALDAADAGFTQLGNNLVLVRQAIDDAFAGRMGKARATLSRVSRADAAHYKSLEAECRRAVGGD